jgi:hypothetical protein
MDTLHGQKTVHFVRALMFVKRKKLYFFEVGQVSVIGRKSQAFFENA